MQADKGKPATTPQTDLYFGGCPYCGKTDGYFNMRRDHWFVCHEHRVLWLIGANLFDSWRIETADDWERNATWFDDYLEVQPVTAPAEKWARSADEPLLLVIVESAVWTADHKLIFLPVPIPCQA